jgi:hypothetical protein
MPACTELAAAYAGLWEAIRASAARGDADEENRLRTRAQVLLCRLERCRSRPQRQPQQPRHQQRQGQQHTRPE